MGLDMYLTKHTYIGANFEHRKIAGDIGLTINGRQIPIKVNRISVIIEQVGYWRKANQIHKWFVDNVQDGNDDCNEYTVSSDHFKELLELVKSALKKKDPDILPPSAGFFFGSQEIDEYYWQDLRDTQKIIEAILNESGVEGAYVDYKYQSSW